MRDGKTSRIRVDTVAETLKKEKITFQSFETQRLIFKQYF